MKNNIKKGPAQDAKFDTTLYDFGRRAASMTPKERSQYREAQKGVLETAGGLAVGGFTGKLLSKFAGIMSRNIGGGLHAVGQGLVRGFGTKSMKKAYDTFTNAPKQYGVFGKSTNTKNIGNISYKSTNANFDKAYNFTPKELKRVQGMNTPITSQFTPTNPRGVETIKWAGGRDVVKPGTPGRGGKSTYSEKNPLWPTFEGTNLDKILYPKNWK